MLSSVPIGGAFAITPEMGKLAPPWGTYFAVNDADRATHLAVELGGPLCMPARDIPGVGRFAMLKSPQGVPFYVMQYAARA